MSDITPEEENALPLPPHWIRVVQNGGGMVYKSTTTDLESEEHPYVVQSLNKARKRPLPSGWTVKETLMSDGSTDYYYCNTTLGISCWDPPSLRQCLAECLGVAGYKAASEQLLKNDTFKEQRPESKPTPEVNKISAAYQQFRVQQIPVSNIQPVSPVREQWMNAEKPSNATEEGIPTVKFDKDKLKEFENTVNNEYNAPPPAAPTDWMKVMQNLDQLHLPPNDEEEYSTEDSESSTESEYSTSSSDDASRSGSSNFDSDDDEEGETETYASSKYGASEYTGVGAGLSVSSEAVDPPTQHSQAASVLSSDLQDSSYASQTQQSYASQDSRRLSVGTDFENNDNDPPLPDAPSQHSDRNDFENDRDPENASQLLEEDQDQYSVNNQGSVRSLKNGEMMNKWSQLAFHRKQADYEAKVAAYESVTDEPYRMKYSKPPLTTSGIRLLVTDTLKANIRVHQLVVLLRIKMAQESGYQCATLQSVATQKLLVDRDDMTPEQASEEVDHFSHAAGEVIHALRLYPSFLIDAILIAPEDMGRMTHVAFMTLHRLMHPFSTDNCITSAFLLTGLDRQVQEVKHLVELFPDLEGKILISRALFITDPVVALGWNPMAQPLPLAPAVPYDSMFGCLLKSYAIRRDVTSYFRVVWRPMFPSIVSVLGQCDNLSAAKVDQFGVDPLTHITQHQQKSSAFANLFSVSVRFLECTLKEEILVSFPPVATAVCRALHAIGGVDIVHTYLLNFLILPNFLKMLTGDHESLENEGVLRDENIEHLINKYFDLDSWWPVNGFASEAFDPVKGLMWLVWRMYSGAAFLDDAAITIITTPKFFNGGPELDTSGVPDVRLRSIICRLKRKLEMACRRVLQMPVDTFGADALGSPMTPVKKSFATALAAEEESAEKLKQRRLESLLMKPATLLTLTVVSRHEIANIFSDVADALVHSNPDDYLNYPLYSVITNFLNHNDTFGDEDNEELLVIPIINSNEQVEAAKDKEFSNHFGEEEHISGASVNGSYSDDESENVDLFSLISGTSEDATFRIQRGYRYKQLTKGLKLANRYEDSVIRLLKSIEQDSHKALLAQMILKSDFSSFSTPDFDANDLRIVSEEQTSVAATVGRHTAVSSLKKAAKSHHGMRQNDHTNYVGKMKRKDIGEDPDGYVARETLDNNYFASLRFGNPNPRASANTAMWKKRSHSSLNMAKHKPPPESRRLHYKDGEGEPGVQLSEKPKPRSRYTKIDVNPSASFLVPTANQKLKELKRNKFGKFEKVSEEMVNRSDRHVSFVKSLRGDGPSKGKDVKLNRKGGNDEGGLANRKSNFASLVPMRNVPAAIPFPEHLRHLVRSDSSNANPFAARDLSKAPAQNATYPPATLNRSSPTIEGTKVATSAADRQLIDDEFDQYFDQYDDGKSELSYGNIDSHSNKHMYSENGSQGGYFVPNSHGEFSDPYDDMSRSTYSTNANSHQRQAQKTRQASSTRSSQPSKPLIDRIPQTVNITQKYLAPTESLLNKLVADGDAYHCQRMGNMPTTLRSSKPRDWGPDFSPSGVKKSAASGARIPRTLDFLAPEEDAFSVTRSINSRGSSPNRSLSLQRSRPVLGDSVHSAGTESPHKQLLPSHLQNYQPSEFEDISHYKRTEIDRVFIGGMDGGNSCNSDGFVRQSGSPPLPNQFDEIPQYDLRGQPLSEYRSAQEPSGPPPQQVFSAAPTAPLPMPSSQNSYQGSPANGDDAQPSILATRSFDDALLSKSLPPSSRNRHGGHNAQSTHTINSNATPVTVHIPEASDIYSQLDDDSGVNGTGSPRDIPPFSHTSRRQSVGKANVNVPMVEDRDGMNALDARINSYLRETPTVVNAPLSTPVVNMAAHASGSATSDVNVMVAPANTTAASIASAPPAPSMTTTPLSSVAPALSTVPVASSSASSMPEGLAVSSESPFDGPSLSPPSPKKNVPAHMRVAPNLKAVVNVKSANHAAFVGDKQDRFSTAKVFDTHMNMKPAPVVRADDTAVSSTSSSSANVVHSQNVPIETSTHSSAPSRNGPSRSNSLASSVVLPPPNSSSPPTSFADINEDVKRFDDDLNQDNDGDNRIDEAGEFNKSSTNNNENDFVPDVQNEEKEDEEWNEGSIGDDINDDLTCDAYLLGYDYDGYDREDSPPETPARRIPVLQRKNIWNKVKLARRLLTGVQVTKHGRSGAPKQRTIIYDDTTQELKWNTAKTSRSSSMFSFATAASAVVTAGDGIIPVSSITEVRKGCQTEVFEKASPRMDPTLCLSIITEARTVDLSLPSVGDRDALLRGLQGLLSGRSVIFR